MDLSIIIVNWNTSELLLQCLDSIYRAKPQIMFEIIVIDNGSTDNSVGAISTRFPEVRIISNDHNMGFAGANNQGLSAGSARYYLLLNSDTLVLPGALDVLINIADNHPEMGIVGPKLLNMDGSLQESYASFPTFWSELIGKNFRRRRPLADSTYIYDVDWIMGACMLVRSEVVADVGMLDDDYFMYSEEVDWCFRIKRQGWKVGYCLKSEVYHLGGGSASRASLSQLILLYRSKILFFRKHYGNHQATLMRYGFALANTVGMVRRVFSMGKKDGINLRQRIAVQSTLVLCLLRNQYPEMNS